MRVLHLIDGLGLGGGAEHSLATMLPLLRERGVESTVVAVLPRPRGLQHTLPEQGFPVRVLEATRFVGRVRELRRIEREVQPDLVHATLRKATLIARAGSFGRHPPLLNSLVSNPYDPTLAAHLPGAPWKRSAFRLLDRVSIATTVDHVHAVSGEVRDQAIELMGVAPGKITVIHRGRSAERLGRRTPERRSAVRAELGLADEPVILTVGRQDLPKAQPVLVEAFAQVLQHHPEARLLIAGRAGADTPAVHAAAARFGVADRITELGHRDDVPDLLAAADVFTLPSLSEGMPGSILEAFGLEVPVVGSDAPSIVEILDGGRLGEVVPRADAPALATALVALLDDATRRAELGRAGRAAFLERYDVDQVADATVTLYERVAGLRRPSGHPLP
jgi:glycosyltransferase involved in cell wall biosynthesis